jgi:hypothetical protein
MPIPAELTKAFERAVDLYVNQWTPSVEEPKVATFAGSDYTITRVCDLIDTGNYSDEIPPPLLEFMWSKVFYDPYADIKAKLKNDHSYANGARCLRELIQRRKAAGG